VAADEPAATAAARTLELVLAHARQAAVVNLLLGAGVTAVFGQELPFAQVITWYLLLATACAFRWYTAAEYRRTLRVTRGLLRAHLLTIVATGLLWGISTSWLGRDAPYLHNVFLTFVLAGNASGAIPLMAPVPVLYRCYLVAAAVPVLFDFVTRQEDLYRLMAFMIGLFCLVLEFTARSYHRALSTALSLDHANARLVDELSRSNASLQYQARHDDLTGLLNRREFEQRVGDAIRRAENEGSVHAIAYLDLDLFKVINDTCGHAAGDQLLRTIAGLIRQQVRQSDCLARIGGDEFVLLMERCTVEQAQRITTSIRKALEDLSFPWHDKRFRISASIGLVPIVGCGETVSGILSAADAACFMAKEQGRNRVHTSQRTDAELLGRQNEMDWVTRINQALEDDRFELMFQAIEPSIATESAGLHFEFLIRLREMDGRLIGPGAFLPAAERYHVITHIDRWVVNAACHWLQTLGARAADVELCAINLSGQSLSNDDFLQFTLRHLRELGTDASRICFEITETTAITNLSEAQRFIAELKSLGCRFALDDFGSGLSSFGYLKALPVDYLKIDGQFVKDIATDPIDRAMVRSMHEIGKLLGKRTIAEFVENDRVRIELAEIGVDYVQGYGIALPKPLTTLFATHRAD